MNLFTVDDEPLTAKWIEAILKNRARDIRICGTAGGGKEALERLKTMKVDILITDIKMPEMDGLELIRRVKRLHPDIYIIILSCYSDFRFTSEAIRLGADDYILKSEISDDDLHQAIQRFLTLRARRNSLENTGPRTTEAPRNDSVRRITLERLLKKEEKPLDTFEKGRALRLLKIDRGPVFCLLLEPRDKSRQLPPESSEVLSTYMDLLCEEGCATPTADGRLCISGRVSVFQTNHYEQKILSGIKTVEETLQRRLSLSFRFGLSSIRSSGEEFPRQYNEADNILALQSFYIPDDGDGTVIRQTELIENREHIQPLLQQLKREVSLEKWKTARSKAGEILELIGRRCILLPNDARGTVQRILELFTRESTDNKWQDPDQFPDYPHLREAAEGALNRQLDEINRKDRISGSIEKACDYILNHYNDSQISLIHVSDYVSLNSSYLSDLFRREMGTTFQDYIAGLRLEKTEYLLKNSSMTISRIAAEAGFQSPSYFTRFFRKYHGMSPSEYRGVKTNQSDEDIQLKE